MNTKEINMKTTEDTTKKTVGLFICNIPCTDTCTKDRASCDRCHWFSSVEVVL